ERRIMFTQNALADDTYLDYLNFLYGDKLTVPNKEDSRRGLANYLSDFQKRLVHDTEFPNEPKQVRSRENVTGIEPDLVKPIDIDKAKFSGFDVVMGVNEQILRIFMDKTPGASFAMEVSAPFSSIYADAVPLGPIL